MKPARAGLQKARRLTTTHGDTTMRFMLLVKASEESEAGVMPSTELLTAMGKDNE